MGNDSNQPDPPLPGNALRGAYYADDPCVFEKDSAPWEIISTPVGPGVFRHWKQYLITPSLIVYREGFKSAMRLRGLAPAGMLSLTLPLSLGSRSRYWNAPPDTNGFHASISDSVDAVFDSGQSHLMVLISLKLLHNTLPSELVFRLKDAAHNRFIRAAPGEVESVSHWLCRVLLETEQHQDTPLNHIAIHAFEAELLDRLARIVQLDMLVRRRPQLSLRQRGLKRALRFLSESSDSLLSIPKLSEVANVSQRTLEYAFREQFNLTPLAFLRLQRFHQARYALIASAPSETTVTHIAQSHGFLEAGRFATNYRLLFGELPFQTLKQVSHVTHKVNSPLLWSAK